MAETKTCRKARKCRKGKCGEWRGKVEVWGEERRGVEEQSEGGNSISSENPS